MNRYILSLILLTFTHFLSAQSLIINGNIVIENASPEGTKVIIYKNNTQLFEDLISKKGRFEFKLALGADYKVSFEKAGYISKNMDINTEVPDEVITSNPSFPPVKLIISLLPQVENVDVTIFEQPIAILAYDPELDDITFDKEYANKIKDRVAQTEQNIKRQLTEIGSAALKKEQMFSELVNTGQKQFDQKKWLDAIDSWEQALALKPDNEDLKNRIALARKELERTNAQKEVASQNAESYKLLIAKADELFNQKKYTEAKEYYTEAVRLDSKDTYPPKQINEIDKLLAASIKQEADQQKRLADMDAGYKKLIISADNSFNSKDYKTAITTYKSALELKAAESYPKEMIAKAEKALTEISSLEAAELEKKRLEEQRIAGLKNEYNRLIADADAAFKAVNYSLAKLRYTEADALKTGEEYPKKQLEEINNILNSSKYKAKMAEYNQVKALAEKTLQQKNYASAKFYYEKLLTILPVDKEKTQLQIDEINKLIETEQLAAIQKEYNGHREKADKAFKEKAYAVAKFYYQKALDIKIGDKYAQDKLQEVEKLIGNRKEKAAEL